MERMTQATKSKEKQPTTPIVRVNWSTLRHLAVSAKLLKWRVEHPQKDTPAMLQGRAIHCAILEPAEYPKRWVTAGACEGTTKAGSRCESQGSLVLADKWYCRVKGHAPAEAAVPAAGMEVLTLEDRAVVEYCAAAVRDHKVAARFLKDGLAEHELEWVDPATGVACRGRLDYLRPDQVVDLKSTREETVRGFTREVAQRLYYGQLAWYHDGAIAANRLTADAPMPVIVSVSTAEPFDVAVYRLSKTAYRAGQILYRDFISRYRDCQSAEYWPGIASSLLELDLPDWASGMNGSEYEGGGW